MMIMTDKLSSWIDAYISSRELSWSSSTIRSEKYRLLGVGQHLLTPPTALWRHLVSSGVSPYARVTLWTRVTDFHEFLASQKLIRAKDGNPYAKFRKENTRLFRNCYTRKLPQISFEEARVRIEKIEDSWVRGKALSILLSGMRYSESENYENGEVVGKGGRRRAVYNVLPEARDARKTYSTFRRVLVAKTGLRPHDLRKIALSKVVENGANEFELKEIAGWTSLAPATSYIRINKSRAKELVEGLRK